MKTLTFISVYRLMLMALTILCLISVKPVSAYHLVGGELTYVCQSNNNYLVKLKIYRDCNCTNCADFDNPAYVFIYDNSNNLVQTLSIPFPGSTQLPVYINNPCLAFPPDICVEEAIYSAQVYLPNISGGYHLVHQRCCRNSTILNISAPNTFGATYYAQIPDPSLGFCNSDPYYNNFPPIALCVGDTLVFDHSATDIDGDSLVYSLCAPYSGASNSSPKPAPGTPAPPPPFGFVNFIPPYSANAPFNGAPTLTIDPQTGVLTGAPTTVGQFVLGVCVKEYRNGNLMSENKRDFQFNIVNCDAVITASMPSYVLECDDYSVNFINNSSGGTFYSWDFGDGVTSTLASPSHTYSDTGVYYAILIANPGWPCADTAYSTVNVYPGMTTDYQYVTHCADSDITFTDLSVSTNGLITTWLWDFNDGNNSTNQSPSHNYAQGGYYNVALTTINDKGCVDIMNQNIYVFLEPEPIIINDEPCEMTLMNFSDGTQLDSGSVVSWEWNIANVDSAFTSSTSYTFANSGFYDITLAVTTEHGCDGSITKTVFIKPIPLSQAGLDTVICPEDIITIGTQVTAGYTYDWSPSTGLNSNQVASPTLSLQNDSDIIITHSYSVTTSFNGCSSMDSINIGVFPNINAEIPSQVIQCLPDNLFFFEALGIYGNDAVFSWDFGDGIGSSNLDTISYHFEDTGSFTVSLTIEDNGCTSSNSIEVIVIDVPIATYDLSTDIGCNPFTVAFNAYSSNPLIADSLITFMWDFGDGTFDTIQNPSHTFDPEGTYYPALTITVGACEGFEEMTQSTTVSVLPTPEAGLLLDPPVASIYNPVVQIIDQSIGADDCILVIGGDTLNICNYTQNYYDPSQTYEDTITHYITQIVTNSFGCTDTIMVEVDVLPAYIFFAPSSFTPNGDGINDLFFGKGFGIKDFEIFIYNRWGDEIFYSKDRYEGWDGHANSGDKIAQQDVYVFVVKITDIYKMPHIVTGKVTLIR